MSSITDTMDRWLYSNYKSKNWDDQIFRQIILDAIGPDSILLDLGAGAGIVSEMNFRGIASYVCGIDPDERVVTNPFLDEGTVGSGERIDYPDERFDCVIADNVLEHLDNPSKVFDEVARVLKPSGRFIFKTPNKFHYMPLVASATPTSFHKFVNRRRGRDAEDTFPTRYRANSKRQILNLAVKTGFEPVRIELVEGRPEYLRFSPPTYLVGWLYERVVNSSNLLANFRGVLIGDLRRCG